MNTTTNYGLKTYQSGDYFNPLTVENANIEAIDTDMKAIDDKTIGRATELVSQGVHAITLFDEDCKTFKFVATANYTAGETFTVNGIQANAYTPSGSALTTNAYVTGSVIIGSLNSDNTAITFYVSGSATADDALRLGGELPSYYATQSDMTNAETDITNLKNQAGNTSIVGIGDGTLTGAVSTINQNLTELQGDLLWTNLNPTSALTATTVNIDLTDYVKFRIYMNGKYVTASSTSNDYDYVRECSKTATNCEFLVNVSHIGFRTITFSNTGISIGTNNDIEFGGGSQTTRNEYNIPMKIYGIK